MLWRICAVAATAGRMADLYCSKRNPGKRQRYPGQLVRANRRISLRLCGLLATDYAPLVDLCCSDGRFQRLG